nr:MAG TPA: hypothetical protein [Caudoviricetes sp.]
MTENRLFFPSRAFSMARCQCSLEINSSYKFPVFLTKTSLFKIEWCHFQFSFTNTTTPSLYSLNCQCLAINRLV